MNSRSQDARPASYQDVLDAPEGVVAELVAGELHTSPRPANRHSLASSEIGAELLMRFRRGRGGPGAWWILYEPELHLGDDVLVPDLAGWRRERMPVIPDAAYFTLAPDWVCEVASPSTNRLDRLLKMPVYLREQVAFVWLVDPIDRYVEAFAYETGRWVLLGRWGSESEARIPPFDAVLLELSAWWLPEDSGSEHT